MRNLFTALGMALGMFTSIPFPHGEWNEDLRRLSIVCLPLVGLIVGGLWLLFSYLARIILPDFISAAFVAAIPFFLTGFMHLDGYMDTSDALLSWRDREERVRILKDVHCGSFAVVMIAVLFIFQFAAALSLDRIFPLLLIPVLSRTGSAISVLYLTPLGHSEYAAAEGRVNRDFSYPVIGMCVVALLVLLFVCGWRGLLTGVGTLAAYATAMRICVRSLGGVSGDLAGFSLTVSELCGLILVSSLL